MATSAHAFGFNFFGNKPKQLPAGQSIYSVSGDVKVNGKNATLSTLINPGDTLQTGKNSELIFVVNSNAMILRSDSTLVIETPEASVGSRIIAGLRILSGKMLSVSRNTPMRVTTQTATLGIRGTGFYIEADPELTYFCTCYGTTVAQSNKDPSSKESITASHHDRPIYIVSDGGTGQNIRNAPGLNHSDQELTLIEALVGRTTPFVFAKDADNAPHSSY